ncbi:gp53-like domain-containing protein [Pseudomonas chlororaphis]|uniref:gp53-like domain-containing protein n=1 Tax=Pseudomonas chlororaphis TaxID=587753 RepID=UPI000F585730|nr:hypothetical protein [Pseudomonas chlororaphis]AZC95308.1 Phage tail fiber protein [Pseudomonas chlororaphis subsp. piscium]
MQKIGDSTNTADAAGEFTEGAPAAGVPATLVKAKWLNAIQRELCGLVLGAGISLNASDDGQVLKAVKALLSAALVGATTTAAGLLRIATQPEVDDGTNNNSAVTPATLKARLAAVLVGATTTAAGLLRIATQPEVDDGTNNNSAVTPATLKARLAAVLVGATTTAAGLLRIATQPEVDDGTNNNSAVTPATLKARLAAVLVGATEQVAGLIRIATTDIMSAGIDNSAAVTVARLRFGFYFLPAINGCIIFPVWLGGFVIQWGTNGHTVSGVQTVSLPTAFPRGVFGAFGGTVAAVTPQGTAYGATYTQISTYSAAGYNVFWIALGY